MSTINVPVLLCEKCGNTTPSKFRVEDRNGAMFVHEVETHRDLGLLIKRTVAIKVAPSNYFLVCLACRHAVEADPEYIHHT